MVVFMVVLSLGACSKKMELSAPATAPALEQRAAEAEKVAAAAKLPI